MAFTGQKQGRFQTVPVRILFDPRWVVTDDDLQALGVPVGLAFFMRPSNTGRAIAVFPCPAVATEAELDEAAWAAFASKNPLALGIEDDVEAMLVHRRRDGRCFCLVVPIDVCYELTALLRRSWQGIDGGDTARAAVDDFFRSLAERSETVPDAGEP